MAETTEFHFCSVERPLPDFWELLEECVDRWSTTHPGQHPMPELHYSYTRYDCGGRLQLGVTEVKVSITPKHQGGAHGS